MDKQFARANVNAQWNGVENIAEKKGKPYVYPNQKEKGIEIHTAFLMGVSLVMLIASPQWGKTGCATYLMYLMTTHNDEETMIHPDNVFIITGMSDKDWREQTQVRMLPIFRVRVYHRNDLHKMINEIRNKRDCLIIIDECHFGTGTEQTLHDCLRASGLLDLHTLIQNNIKILCISATPGNTLVDAERWGSEHQKTIIAECGPKYTSFRTLLDENRVKSTIDLKDKDEVKQMLDDIEKRWTTPRYHIIRSSDAQLKVLKQQVIKRGYLSSIHNSSNRITKETLDMMLSTQPAKHHFIYIKSFWRAAKTLPDTYIGICYEKTADYTVASQGLGGRLLGYEKQNGEFAPLLYTNELAIQEYVNWFNNGCNYYMSKKYNTANLKVVKGHIKKKTDSMVDPKEISNLRETIPVKEKYKVSELTKVGVVKNVPCDAILATSLTIYTNKDFMKKFALKSIPSDAKELSDILKKTGHSANVAFKKNAISAVTNPKNYYTQTWAGCQYQIIKNKESEVIVIERDRNLLNKLEKGQKIVVHNWNQKLVLYEN